MTFLPKLTPAALAVFLASLAMSFSPAAAALVVEFDPATYGSGSLAARSSGNDGTTWWVQRAFSDVGETSWSAGASYTGPTLYGGFRGESNFNKTSTDGYSLTGFDIRYQTDGTFTDGTDRTGRLTFAWVFDSGRTGMSFGDDSYLQVGRKDYTTLSRFDNLGDVRWLVRSGTTYYVSQTKIANNAAGLLLDAAELADETWAVYNPADAFAFNLTLSFNTPTSALTDLNAFGWMTYKSEFTKVRHWVAFNQFKADAVIPEPATLSLLGAGAVVALRRRRRYACQTH